MLLTNTADGGTAGNVVSTANSGAASGTPFDTVTGTATFDSTAFDGGLGYRVRAADGGADLIWNVSSASGNAYYTQCYLRINTLPPVNGPMTILRLDNTSNDALWINMIHSGALHVHTSAAGGGTVLYDSGPLLTLSTWYRLNLYTEIAGGDFRITLFDGTSETNLVDYSVSSGQFVFFSPVETLHFGLLAFSGSEDIVFDDLAFSDTASIGPYTPPAPPASATARHYTGTVVKLGADQTITLSDYVDSGHGEVLESTIPAFGDER